MPDLQCFVTKKAREITPLQYKGQTDTFRYGRAFDEMRQDAVYSFYLYHWYIINDDIYAAERETFIV